MDCWVDLGLSQSAMKEGFFILLLGTWKVISAQSGPCFNESTEVIAVQGEALSLSCFLNYKNFKATNFSWFKDGTHPLQPSEDQRVHYHGGELLFLPLLLTDKAVYTCNCYLPRSCVRSQTNVTVYEADNFDKQRLLTPIVGSEVNPSMLCPKAIMQLCQGDNVTLAWYKDSLLIPNVSEEILSINNASKGDEGIYSCNCTWKHGGMAFHSSASRKLIIKAPYASSPPVIRLPTHNATETADLGSSKRLVCVVFFGINVEDFCRVRWTVNGLDTQWNSRFLVETTREMKNGTIYTAVLTIVSVAKEDFGSEFKCIAKNMQRWDSRSVFLKPKETIYKLLVINGCVLLAFLLAFVVLKHFRIDLILHFRGVFKTRSRADGKVYDAYVIYQIHNLDEATEKKMYTFVTRLLPEVLEEKCGYRLFIHGRDDLPGEDHMELIGTRMKMSSRLMVILTPGIGSRDEANLEDYDRQVGLHQALVQEELKVILIELERMHGYSHLPQGLQHLISKSAPLRWKEQGRNSLSPNSSFWKHVRYMMPVQRCHRVQDDLKLDHSFKDNSDPCLLEVIR
ncbi:interleukin-1 receptor-like 1 [Conger conger]|uniref:interleukin-1 receptor-like 1 n=1 Tax=Conger conger TaxID=82655 RepID=UPI002A5A7C86|nr:interleukin-1 receptor-like 1 [Conger conger]